MWRPAGLARWSCASPPPTSSWLTRSPNRQPTATRTATPTRLLGWPTSPKPCPTTALGEVDPGAYRALLRALRSGRPADFKRIPLGGKAKLANPEGAFSFELQGPDPWQRPLAPPPALDSEAFAAEMTECYWLALARDIPYARYGQEPITAAAIADLRRFAGNRDLDARTLFRSTDAEQPRGEQGSVHLPVPVAALCLWQHPDHPALPHHRGRQRPPGQLPCLAGRPERPTDQHRSAVRSHPTVPPQRPGSGRVVPPRLLLPGPPGRGADPARLCGPLRPPGAGRHQPLPRPPHPDRRGHLRRPRHPGPGGPLGERRDEGRLVPQVAGPSPPAPRGGRRPPPPPPHRHQGLPAASQADRLGGARAGVLRMAATCAPRPTPRAAPPTPPTPAPPPPSAAPGSGSSRRCSTPSS